METKFTKGPWKQMKMFDSPILIKDEENNREWWSNTISLHDTTGRIVCEVDYQTDTAEMGWGKNEKIEKWQANAKLIAAAPDLFEACVLALGLLEAENIHGLTRKKLEAAIKKTTE